MHLLGLELGNFRAGGDGGMGIRVGLRQARGISERLRRQRRGLCGSRERSGSRRDPECKFQKVPTLHDMSSRYRSRDAEPSVAVVT